MKAVSKILYRRVAFGLIFNPDFGPGGLLAFFPGNPFTGLGIPPGGFGIPTRQGNFNWLAGILCKFNLGN